VREALVTVVAKVVVVTGWGDCFVAVTCGHLVGTALSVVRRPLTEASSKRQRWSAGRPVRLRKHIVSGQRIGPNRHEERAVERGFSLPPAPSELFPELVAES